MRRQSEALGASDPELKSVIDRFREDELAHKQTAIEQGAQGRAGLCRALDFDQARLPGGDQDF
ncbi:MAG: demethoxyubiquinone hydroxylase family protein [Terricaulis sp.]